MSTTCAMKVELFGSLSSSLPDLKWPPSPLLPPYEGDPCPWGSLYPHVWGDEEITNLNWSRKRPFCPHLQDYAYFAFPTKRRARAIRCLANKRMLLSNWLPIPFANTSKLPSLIGSDRRMMNCSMSPSISATLIFLRSKESPFPNQASRIFRSQKLPSFTLIKFLQGLLFRFPHWYNLPEEYESNSSMN